MGLQSVHHTLSLSLLPPQDEDFSHSSPAPAWGPSHGSQSSTNFSSMGPSHGLQFFMNCSSMGPFHGLQSFRHRLLQHGSPAGSQVLPENLLHHRLLSPQVCRSCQETAPARASPWSPGHLGGHPSPCSGVGSSLPGLQVGICSPAPLRGLGAQPAASPRAVGASPPPAHLLLLMKEMSSSHLVVHGPARAGVERVCFL